MVSSLPESNGKSNGRAPDGTWLPGHTPEGAKPWKPGEAPKSPGRPPVARTLRRILREPVGGKDGPQMMEAACRGVALAAVGGDASAFNAIRDTIDGKPVSRVAAVAVVASPSSDEQLAASVRALISAFGSTGTDAVD